MAQLLFFGLLADPMGTGALSLPLPGDVRDTDALRAWLEANQPNAGALNGPSVRIAVNGTIVPEPHPIADRDEIAFLPPVGGG